MGRVGSFEQLQGYAWFSESAMEIRYNKINDFPMFDINMKISKTIEYN